MTEEEKVECFMATLRCYLVTPNSHDLEFARMMIRYARALPQSESLSLMEKMKGVIQRLMEELGFIAAEKARLLIFDGSPNFAPTQGEITLLGLVRDLARAYRESATSAQAAVTSEGGEGAAAEQAPSTPQGAQEAPTSNLQEAEPHEQWRSTGDLIEKDGGQAAPDAQNSTITRKELHELTGLDYKTIVKKLKGAGVEPIDPHGSNSTGEYSYYRAAALNALEESKRQRKPRGRKKNVHLQEG